MIRFMEMARFRGFGITIEVRSNGHGEIDNQSKPAHAHILNNAGVEVAEIVITKSPPTKPSDIQWYRTDTPPNGLAGNIVKLAGRQNPALKRVGILETTWQSVVRQWLYFHGK